MPNAGQGRNTCVHHRCCWLAGAVGYDSIRADAWCGNCCVACGWGQASWLRRRLRGSDTAIIAHRLPRRCRTPCTTSVVPPSLLRRRTQPRSQRRRLPRVAMRGTRQRLATTPACDGGTAPVAAAAQPVDDTPSTTGVVVVCSVFLASITRCVCTGCHGEHRRTAQPVGFHGGCGQRGCGCCRRGFDGGVETWASRRTTTYGDTTQAATWH